MKIAYAFRRGTFYPHIGGRAGWGLAPKEHRRRYVKKVKEIGFDGFELGLENFPDVDPSDPAVADVQKELEDAGVPCVALRAGGALCQPHTAEQNRKRLERAVQIASSIGASVVNSALGARSLNPHEENRYGGLTQFGSSQKAAQQDFERTAKTLREVGQMAGSLGVNITIEVHQNSLADNSWSALHLLDLTDSPYVFANPDLGNIYWNYMIAEEGTEEAIMALAPRSKYWHCKNLLRVAVPEVNRSYFLRVPLPDGEIDYRFAVSAMLNAGYDGYLAVEGGWAGDQLYQDQRSFEYVKGLLAELAEG